MEDKNYQINEMADNHEMLKQAYDRLQKQFDQVNMNRSMAQLPVMNDRSHSMSANQLLNQTFREIELQKENDFLHMRLQQLSKEVIQIGNQR